MRAIRRILGLLRRRDLSTEIADELRHHIDQEAAHLEARGHSPREARRLARLRFGPVDATYDDVRRAHGLGWVDDAWRDGAVAARAFARRPGLPAAVALTLALGIGAGTLVFAAIEAVLLQPPGYAAGDRLVFVWRTAADGEHLRVPGPDAAEIAASVEPLTSVAFLANVREASLARTGGPAVPVRVATATPNWFEVLGVETTLGRGMQPDDGRADASPIWLLTDAFFRGPLGGDPSVLGSTLELDGRSGTVAGVLPADFRLLLPAGAGIPTDVEVWSAIRGDLSSLQRPERETDQDSDNTGIVVARMREGATLSQVDESFRALGARLQERFAAYRAAGWGLEARAVGAELVSSARPVLRAVAVAVALVLLLAAANAAGLLLSRAAARSRELAVRTVLGGRRSRLIRQHVLENTILAMGGAILGLGAAALLLRPVATYVARLAPGAAVRLDATTLAFVAVLIGTLVALTSAAVLLDPSLRAVTPSLTARGATGWTRGARRLRGWLVAVQVAASLALVVGAGVMTRTASLLAAQDLGFRPANVLAFRIGIAFPADYRGPADRAALVSLLESRMLAIPGVESVGLVGGLPLADPEFTQPWSPGRSPADVATDRRANYRVVTTGYFDAVGTRVLEGRAFRAADDRQDRRVVIIDARLARQLTPAGSAVGRTIRLPVDGAIVEATVVGVVDNVRFESPSAPGRATIYVPYRHEASRRIAFVVRTRTDPEAFVRPIAEAIAGVDARIAMHDARSMTAVVDEALRPARTVTRLLSAFAALALLLALVALHAAVAYGIDRRTSEIGLRLAVGASPRHVIVETMRSGLAPCMIGLGLGLLLVIAAAPALRALVYGVSPVDPSLVGGSALLILAACVAACRIAAGRAARIAPATALSHGG